jgi:hypothetical protein
VKFILVCGEKPEFLGNPTIDFWKWQDDSETNTGNEECGRTNTRINECSDGGIATGRLCGAGGST